MSEKDSTPEHKRLWALKESLQRCNERLQDENKALRDALEYVARQKDTPTQLAGNVLDECVAVCEQALAKADRVRGE